MTDAAETLEDLMPPAGRSRWGPFSPAISHSEMLSRLRVTAAFAQSFVKPGHPIHEILCDAESGEPADLEAARLEFDRLPALRQRDILDSYAKHWQRRIRGAKRRAADAGA
jgi:hypothetical protein